MKLALIGQDIPMLLPSLLADLLFAGNQSADVFVEERNPAMRQVLEGYGAAVIRKSGLPGRLIATGDRAQALAGADCVVYAGDGQAASRFQMDRQALSGTEENDPGLSDQARVNGGIGGLMHALRAGESVLALCETLKRVCPGALVVNLTQPLARTTAAFAQAGLHCLGLGPSPLRGPNGLAALCAKLGRKTDSVNAVLAGLPGFSFLLSLEDAATGRDLLPNLEELVRADELGRLTHRWLDWYDAIAVGDTVSHAEFLPAEPDFIPETEPALGETVEQRKERILRMNTVARAGNADPEGAMAQLLLLAKAPAERPLQLALAVLRGSDLTAPAVSRLNNGELPALPKNAIIESKLTLRGGREEKHGYALPPALAEICGEIDETNRLAARAAAGDRTALREAVETDPALAGLDRLYCQELVDKLIELHEDVLPRL